MFARYHEVSTERFELKLEKGLDGIRLEMERTRADILNWNFLMWVGQFAAITAVLSFMLGGQ